MRITRCITTVGRKIYDCSFEYLFSEQLADLLFTTNQPAEFPNPICPLLNCKDHCCTKKWRRLIAVSALKIAQFRILLLIRSEGIYVVSSFQSKLVTFWKWVELWVTTAMVKKERIFSHLCFWLLSLVCCYALPLRTCGKPMIQSSLAHSLIGWFLKSSK